MANIDAPKGLICIGRMGGGVAGRSLYPVDVLNATAIFKGDLITAEADGNVKPSAANDGVAVIGVAEGLYDTNKKPISYLPATTVGYVLVVDDPYALFMIQDDASATSTSADRFATANHVAGAGNTGTGLSGHELNASDIGTGLQMQILGILETPNNTWGDNADYIVRLAEHAYNNVASI